MSKTTAATAATRTTTTTTTTTGTAATPTKRIPAEELVACCPPLMARALSPADAEDAARLLKVLADPVRLRVLSLILSTGNEACVCDLTEAFDLTQPTMSHHLKVLYDAGLVDRERRGVWVYYRARQEALVALAKMFTPA